MNGFEKEQPFRNFFNLRNIRSLLTPRSGKPADDRISQEVKSFQFGSEGRSPFDVFLQNSTQKRNLAEALGRILREADGTDQKTYLDIGSSKGTLWMMLAGYLRSEGFNNPIHFHLIEPDPPSVVALRERAQGLYDYTNGKITSTIHQMTWEDFDTSRIKEPVDAVLCSHTIYYLPKKAYPELFGKMIGMVRGSSEDHGPGKVIVVARTEDPIYYFIQAHFLDATGEPFNEKTIRDAAEVLVPMTSDTPGLQYAYHESRAEVRFPFASDPYAAKTMVGFFLQRPWDEISSPILERIQNSFYVGDPVDVTLPQIDGIIEISKY